MSLLGCKATSKSFTTSFIWLGMGTTVLPAWNGRSEAFNPPSQKGTPTSSIAWITTTRATIRKRGLAKSKSIVQPRLLVLPFLPRNRTRSLQCAEWRLESRCGCHLQKALSQKERNRWGLSFPRKRDPRFQKRPNQFRPSDPCHLKESGIERSAAKPL